MNRRDFLAGFAVGVIIATSSSYYFFCRPPKASASVQGQAAEGSRADVSSEDEAHQHEFIASGKRLPSTSSKPKRGLSWF